MSTPSNFARAWSGSAFSGIWIGVTVQKGNGKYAAGDYTTILLDPPAASPCNDQVVTDILLGKGGAPDPTILLPYLRCTLRAMQVCGLS
ncbi:hypothetical protein OKW38_000146 [Paraburkholderia sp. MM5496-R1]